MFGRHICLTRSSDFVIHKTLLCNRPSGIYIFTWFSEKTSPGWLIFHWKFFPTCISPMKAKIGKVDYASK